MQWIFSFVFSKLVGFFFVLAAVCGFCLHFIQEIVYLGWFCGLVSLSFVAVRAKVCGGADFSLTVGF